MIASATRDGLRRLAPARLRGLATPGHAIWSQERAAVVRLAPREAQRGASAPAPARARAPARSRPVLLVPSIINRGYILDLAPGQSVAAGLAEHGLDVFILDWGSPTASEAHLDLHAYALRLLPAAIRAVQRASGAAEVDLFGYCLGGTFALIAGACGTPGVGRLVCLATPVDLAAPGSVAPLVDARLVQDIDALARAFPVVPGGVLWAAFQALDPVGIGRKWRGFGARLLDGAGLGFARRFLAQERWVHDLLPVTGRALGDVVERLYRRNALARGTLVLGGRAVRLEAGRAPVLNVIAAGDTIVPPACSLPLAGLWGGPVETATLEGGHIGVSVGSRAPSGLWRRAAVWLAEEGAQ